MRFEPKTLHKALDAHRTARHMTWEQVASDLHIELEAIEALEEKGGLETDDILQMTRWLGLNIESFIGEGKDPMPGPHPEDWRSTGRVLRFDTKALFEAVDKKRRAKDLSWQEAAVQIGTVKVDAGMLLRLVKTGRIDVYAMLGIVAWLREKTTKFTRLTPG